MSPLRRLILCLSLLISGVATQAGLEHANRTERPDLKSPLDKIPFDLADWSGKDEPIDPEIRVRAQTDDCLNRIYESPRFPGRRMALWINYSKHGLNLRHSPEVCLPSNGWTKLEAETKVVEVLSNSGRGVKMTRLGYAREDRVQQIGFLYYIFGEGALEHWVRQLPITSRSSHGRTTRGSGLTVEVFCPGEADPDGSALLDFAQALLAKLEPSLPENRAEYYIP